MYLLLINNRLIVFVWDTRILVYVFKNIAGYIKYIAYYNIYNIKNLIKINTSLLPTTPTTGTGISHM